MKRHLWKWFTLLGLLVLLAIVGGQIASAQDDTTPPLAARSPIHPTFPLLDAEGENVLDSNQPVSAMQTCGSCHDTEFIANHSFHADAGLSGYAKAGTVGGNVWDSSQGSFGRWDPLFYRYLSAQGDERVDLTTVEWVQLFSLRHPGGGPAVISRDGQPLTSLTPDADNVETSVYDPASGEFVAWDWAESGTVEMNCFLCHLAEPNNEARLAVVQAGEFAWASTATLLGTGLVTQEGESWVWNAAAFSGNGELLRDYVTVQDPTNNNCGQCHGVTHTDLNTPLTLGEYTLADYNTLTTGQVMSPQRLANSGLNLEDKLELSRSWDIHTERVVSCTDCHHALNNPIYFESSSPDTPEHLAFDPRRIDLGEYLYRPLHEFAKGQSPQTILAPELDNTVRRCESCHEAEAVHAWLPYQDRHFSALSCETCHTPELFAPALEYVDWTVLHEDSQPIVAYRGIEGETINASTLMSGYEPILLPRENQDGTTSLAPYNVITYWYWVYGNPERPVALRDLQAAWFEGDSYHPDVLKAFDDNKNGSLSNSELLINNSAKEQVIVARLSDLGLDNPHIAGEVRPYSINHNVTNSEWATRECASCHSEASQVTQPISLADRTPGGIAPTPLEGQGVVWSGGLHTSDAGQLFFQPQADEAGLYIFGHSHVTVIDWIGIVAFLGVWAGVIVHGGLRYRAARQLAHTAHHVPHREVYMYDVYERLWHWLQTGAIMLLIFTGLVIHKPEMLGIFSFSYMVQVHNILAAILVVNAAMSLFYHLASGEIKQFLPRPRGFFDQAVVQALYYVRGIFKGEPHPYEKTRDSKLNPLQQMTYFGLLNVLLPLQIITGALMWGVQQWPDIANRLGGLPFLAPFHTLIAWLFASFIVMHVYLTTTGHTPMAGIQAMMLGWEEVETHEEPGVVVETGD